MVRCSQPNCHGAAEVPLIFAAADVAAAREPGGRPPRPQPFQFICPTCLATQCAWCKQAPHGATACEDVGVAEAIRDQVGKRRFVGDGRCDRR